MNERRANKKIEAGPEGSGEQAPRKQPDPKLAREVGRTALQGQARKVGRAAMRADRSR